MRFSHFMLAAALALCSCGNSNTADSHEGHDHEHEGHNHEHEGEGHDHNHEGEHGESEEIVVEPEKAKKFGIVSQPIQYTTFSEVIPVSGRIEAPSTDIAAVTAKASGILRLRGGLTVGSKVKAGGAIGSISTTGVQGGSATEAARIEAASAKREMERLKPLYEEGIVTRRDYDSAVAAYRAAKARAGSVAVNPGVSSPISGTITEMLAQDGQFVDVGTPIATVARESNNLTLRADVPERYSAELGTIKTAMFRPAYSDQTLSLKDMGGHLVSASRTSGATTRGYVPVFFNFNAKGTSLVAGGFAQVYLIGSERPNALVVPIEAITEAQGIKYLYVQIDEEGYEKRAVTLGGSDGINVEILQGIRPGDKVVVQGTTFVKLAETKAVPEGHTHNH